MNKLTERNNEIYRRWQAGENHIDLADEFNRSIDRIQTLIRRRNQAENEKDYIPGPNNRELHEQNRSRDENIVASRAAGATYRSLAAKYGISPERIRQICLWDSRH